ncbi:MAG: FlgB family protein [Rhodobacterales bacterium]|nr:FlgB family protein [Rhodobacterales bacterium]
MSEKIEIFRMASALMKHSATRQNVLAQNIANSDTPGYQARDLGAFRDLYQSDGSDTGLRATRARHLNGSSSMFQSAVAVVDGNVANPNGNTVSLEEEMMKAVDAQRQHQRAVTIYKSSLGILRSVIGR